MKAILPRLRNVRYSLDCRKLDMPVVRECGFLTTRGPSPLTQHRNDGFEITLVASGRARWEIIGGEVLELHGGQFCLMQPGLPHRGLWDLIEPIDLFYVVLNFGAVDALRHLPLTGQEARPLVKQLTAAGNRVSPATPEMLGLYERLKAPMARCAQGERETLLVPRLRGLLGQFVLETAVAVAMPGPNPPEQLARRVRAFVLSHLDEPLAVEELARQVGLHRSHFSERFQKETGFSPGDFVARVRCQRAAELLAATDRPITAIAMECGFSSSQYFARCFRKYLGRSPRQARG